MLSKIISRISFGLFLRIELANATVIRKTLPLTVYTITCSMTFHAVCRR